MEQLNQQTEILELGRKIVKELIPEGGDRISLLENWMGHYIAELIFKIENKKNDLAEEKLQKECFETILKFWEKRSYVPNNNLPLNNIRRAINTLSELKSTRNIWERMRISNETSWESVTLQIHDNYVDTLKICLNSLIAQNALGKEKVWADEFGEFLTSEEKVIINELEDLLEEPQPITLFITEEVATEIEHDKVEKDRLTRTFDRLESILEDQKELIEKLKNKLLDDKE